MVEVITPIHNDDVSLLWRNICSVKAQIVPCVQTVVDDASDKELSEKYRKLCEENNVLFLRLDENVGPGLARQYGVDHGMGMEYIMFLDADDVLFPNAAKELEKELIRTNTDIAIGEILFEDPQGDKLIKYPTNVTYCCGKLYKRSVMQKNDIRFCDKLFYNEDSYYNTVYRYFCAAEAVVAIPVTIWCNNRNSVTKRSDYVYAEKYNIEYAKSNIFMIDRLFKVNRSGNFGVQFGQLYNAYQDEIVFKHDLKELNSLIAQYITPIIAQLESANDFYNAYATRTVTHRGGVLYQHSPKEFLALVKNGMKS